MSNPKTSFETDIAGRISQNPSIAKEIDAVFRFDISGPQGGTWTVDLKNNVGVRAGAEGEADCTIATSDENWMQLAADPSIAMQLFFSQQLTVQGNQMLAMKLTEILR